MTEIQQYWRWLCGLIALVLLVSIIRKIVRWFTRPHFTLKAVVFEPKKGSQTMQITIPVTHKAKVTLTPVKADGTPAAIDGALVHGTSSDPTVAHVETIDGVTDGLTFYVVPGDTPGQTANLPFSADALLGDGVIVVSGSIDANTSDGVAGSFSMNVAFEPK